MRLHTVYRVFDAQGVCAAGTITRRKGGGVKQPRYLIHRSTIRALIEAEKAA